MEDWELEVINSLMICTIYPVSLGDIKFLKLGLEVATNLNDHYIICITRVSAKVL